MRTLPHPHLLILGLTCLPLALGQEEKREEAAEEPASLNAREEIEGSLPRSWSTQLRWRSIGPANMGGRITAIAAHPEDSRTYWVGTASGGVLKTTNNGVTYEHQFTRMNTSSVGQIAVAPSDGEIVWVGTGENNPRNSVSWGDGVYRSTDGGETWQHRGLKESFQISSIVIHPENPDIVYVGALGRLWGENEERGLYKTTDGGESWEKILYVDERTGVIDMRVKPDDPDVLLVATYERKRDIYCSNDPAVKWGPGGGLWRTVDGGESFTRVTEGLPSCELGRIGLDWYLADPNVVFAVVESERITQEPEDAAYMGIEGTDAEIGVRLTEISEEGPAAAAELRKDDVVLRIDDQTLLSYSDLLRRLRDHKAGETVVLEVVRDRELLDVELTFDKKPEREDPTDSLGRPRPGPFHIGLGGQRANIQEEQGEEGSQYGGVYRSDDAGLTWQRINSVNPRPMYYSEIRVDPSDSNYVYVLGTSLYRSKDGGETFTSDGASRGVHVDHHALWIDPDDGRHAILGNDGGIYVTWDRFERWDHHAHVAIGQFYNITCDTNPDYKVYGGLQDNGSWGGPSRSGSSGGPVNTDWFRIGGGDGFVCRVDAEDPDQLYYESQGGAMGRRNLRTGEGGFIRPRAPRGERYRFNWNTPFMLSHHNSRVHYSAGNHVFRSLDRGNSARRISPDITETDRGSATALAESPVDSDLLYVGTDDGALWVTRDGGHTWTDLWTLNEGLEEGAEEEEAADDPEAEEEDEDVETAASVSSDDPLSGTWSCKASGEGIEESEQGRFELVLVLAEGKLSGRLYSEIGEGPISKVSFDAEEGALRFQFEGETITLSFKAQLKKGRLEGEITGAGGAFSFGFTGERTGPPPAEEEEVEEVLEGTQSAPEEEQDDEEKQEKPKKRRFKKDTIDQLLPGRFYVSSITPSRHKASRVYVTFDGHRSDDDRPWVFLSDDYGESWESLKGNLEDEVGSVRDLDEDLENRDLLYLGTEFGVFVSIDRGDSWTELGGGLPTVPVHDFVQHVSRGELIAGTHGRSVWILDVRPLRKMSDKSTREDAELYPPGTIYLWGYGISRGSSGTRRFVGENPPSSASIYYSLGRKAKQIELVVKNPEGEVVRELEASAEKGLHRVSWDLRRGVTREDREGNRRFRRGRRVSAGTYKVVLTVGGETLVEEIVVKEDPTGPPSPY